MTSRPIGKLLIEHAIINCWNADLLVLYTFSVPMNQNHVTTTQITYSKTSMILSHVTLPSKALEMWWLRKHQVWHHLFGSFQWEFVLLWGYCLWCVVTSVDISGIYLLRKEGGSRRTEVNSPQWKTYSMKSLPTYWCQGLTMILILYLFIRCLLMIQMWYRYKINRFHCSE